MKPSHASSHYIFFLKRVLSAVGRCCGHWVFLLIIHSGKSITRYWRQLYTIKSSFTNMCNRLLHMLVKVSKQEAPKLRAWLIILSVVFCRSCLLKLRKTYYSLQGWVLEVEISDKVIKQIVGWKFKFWIWEWTKLLIKYLQKCLYQPNKFSSSPLGIWRLL